MALAQLQVVGVLHAELLSVQFVSTVPKILNYNSLHVFYINFICLFTYLQFINDAVSSLNSIAQNGGMISE
jgi:hypothetical protein